MISTSPACWTWDVDPILIPIAGAVQVRWYGVWFLLVFWLGYLLLRWQTRRAGRDDAVARGFVYWGAIGLVLGAWVAHRLFYEWETVRSHPLALLDVRHGISGLSSHGAAVGLMTAMWLYARRVGVPLGEMFDRFSFSAAVGATLVRIGNFFNSEIVGVAVGGGHGAWWAVCLPRHDASPPWGSNLPVARHPTQLYEAAIGLTVLAALVLVDRWAGGERRPRWLLAGTFLLTYFPLRIAVEYLKEPRDALGVGWNTGQWLSLPFVVLGVIFVRWAFVDRLPASGSSAR